MPVRWPGETVDAGARRSLGPAGARVMVGIVCTVLAVAAPAPAHGGVPSSVLVSCDTAASPGDDVVTDEQVVAAHGAGWVRPLDLGELPHEADVTAVHIRFDGWVLFAIDTAAFFGNTAFLPADVIRFKDGAHGLAFNGLLLPSVGTKVDAVTMIEDGGVWNLLLSFDTDLDLSGTVVADEDLARYSVGSWSLFFDGSAAGVPTALDLDGAELLPDGTMLVSFDGAGEFGGVTFSDEDVLAYSPTGSWSMAHDLSGWDDAWIPVDVDAVGVEPWLFADGFESGDTSEWASP